ATTGTHSIKLSDESFEVACDGKTAGPGWTIIQQRIDDNVSFARTFDEYKAGFGNMTGSFFIGLRKLHEMTSIQPHELFIALESLSGETRNASYNNFKIANEIARFRLQSLGDYNGTAGNALENSLNNEFIAYDSKIFLIENPTTPNTSGWWIDYKLSG
ncbi:hypothetical protein KR044_010271, partial [Drosophila immigrans]